MENKIIIVIGAYGSGKSEYSINLAKDIKHEGQNIILVDLDVVNPYFRSRDVREKFKKEGITVIAPEGEFQYADLPMLSPRIMGAVQNFESSVILDVGGDPAGCRTLARYISSINKRCYEMHFVVNTKRPFTANKSDIIEMLNNLEQVSKLKITELISNANLMEHTEESVVKDGIDILQEVADERKILFEKYLVLEKYSDKIPGQINGKKKVVLKYYLSKPWEMVNKVHKMGI